MYERNPVFEQPKDEAVKVWRYMDFTKLISLVDSRCLFFSRADKLGDLLMGGGRERPLKEIFRGDQLLKCSGHG
jgi:hypothetical protein